MTTTNSTTEAGVSDAEIEAGAAALVDSCIAKGHWAHASDESKECYRAHARAVLIGAAQSRKAATVGNDVTDSIPRSVLTLAIHHLRSVANGNSLPTLADVVADELQAALLASDARVNQQGEVTDEELLAFILIYKFTDLSLRKALTDFLQSRKASAQGGGDREALHEVVGCFRAAEVEGLAQALEETTDERLKDLVTRRLMHANYAAKDALDECAVVDSGQTGAQGGERAEPVAFVVRDAEGGSLRDFDNQYDADQFYMQNRGRFLKPQFLFCYEVSPATSGMKEWLDPGECPELNLSNYTADDVANLNDWAVHADAAILRLTEERNDLFTQAQHALGQLRDVHEELDKRGLPRLQANGLTYHPVGRVRAGNTPPNQDSLVGDAERFVFVIAAMLNPNSPEASAMVGGKVPDSIEQVRFMVDAAIRAGRKGTA